MVAITVNGQRKEVAVDGNTPLLWVLREHLKLTGTKFGCGIASCGACTVHIDGKAVRSMLRTARLPILGVLVWRNSPGGPVLRRPAAGRAGAQNQSLNHIIGGTTS